MGLIGMIEEAVRLDAELLRIRCLDADAPEEQELKRRIRRIAASKTNTPVDVATEIAEKIMTGMSAEQAIHEMETGEKQWTKTVEMFISRMRAAGRGEEEIKNYVTQAAENATVRGR